MSRPLHVAVGVLAGVVGGPASYARRLIDALVRLPDAPRVSVLCDSRRALDLEVCDVIEVPMRGGIDRLRWQHFALPAAIHRLAPDLYHDTKNALPRRLRVPGVVTIHDLAYHTVPETFGFWSRRFLRWSTTDAARRAQGILVPSQATAADLARIHPFTRAKTVVVPHGIDPPRQLSAERRTQLHTELRLPARYVLHVGTLQARKNVDRLIRAVRSLRAREADLRCVLVGRRGWLAEPTLREIARDDTTIWLGKLPDEALAAVYSGATVFVSPSAYEGFGFTVADALAAGVPTIISAVSSLPEVCGEAALRLDSLDETAICAAIARVLSDAALANSLRAAGPRRASQFPWSSCASAHLAAYRRAVVARRG